MLDTIPENFLDLFRKRAFAHLATLMPDGGPQVTPIWCEYDGSYVVCNSARGRQKMRNLQRDPRVALAILDPDNPYRYMEIRGQVVEVTEQGAEEHIDRLAQKYLGVERYPYRQPGEVRLIFKVKPNRVRWQG